MFSIKFSVTSARLRLSRFFVTRTRKIWPWWSFIRLRIVFRRLPICITKCFLVARCRFLSLSQESDLSLWLSSFNNLTIYTLINMKPIHSEGSSKYLLFKYTQCSRDRPEQELKELRKPFYGSQVNCQQGEFTHLKVSGSKTQTEGYF